MREIKFRGKEVETGDWIHGDLFQRTGFYPAIITSYIKDDGKIGYSENAVIQDTIGQFTGLYDKHGKEIYDGDIIYSEFSDGSKSNCLIGWNEENSCFGLMDEYDYRSKLEGYDFPRFDNAIFYNFSKHSSKFEVIGNIHDNPELLKGGNQCEQ